MKCQEVMDVLEALSPGMYACDWDNVGLLVGRKEKEIHRILVALDATREVIEYAVNARVDMLVTHHPMIFSPVKQVNEDTVTSEKVLTLAEHGICYYAMHTNFDAVGGMAELAAGPKYLNLSDTGPITLCKDSQEGIGRYGRLPKPMTVEEVCGYVKEKFHLSFVMVYQGPQEGDKVFDKIAVLPGSGRKEMNLVKNMGYELYLTGDYGHHEGIDAMDMGMTVIDATHYGLEHIFMEYIVDYLKRNLSNDMEVEALDTGCPVAIM